MRYTAIRSEGGLIPDDLLDKIANEEVAGQKPADFGLPKGRHLLDQIQSVWSDALSFWNVFRRRMESPPESDPYGTTLTREKWLYQLLNDPQTFAYDLKLQSSAVSANGASFPISHFAGDPKDSPPIDIEGFRVDLDHRRANLRTSPRAMVQEFLNRSDQHLWGIVTNGLRLLLLRDSVRTAQPTYLEFDLQTILEGNHFNEFALFYRLCHRSRLPRPSEDPTKCWLEQYYQLSIEQGGRVREKLRDGVEEALKILGTGLLRHPANTELRERIETGALKPTEYHRQLLRLVYRLLFLMVAEERHLILAVGDEADRRQRIYDDFYSINRLRERAEHIVEHSTFGDLWIGLQQTFSLFSDAHDNNPLGIPPLNGELFGYRAIPDLEGTDLYNDDLIRAIRLLSLFHGNKILQRVNYSALNVEELGSVYESLLDFRPEVVQEPEGWEFKLAKGSERKTTGSYYTRPELVRELIQSALVPVLEDRIAQAEKQTAGKPQETVHEAKMKAILGMSVCDPACGSGHFLLEAARRLGRELACVKTGEDEPTPEEFHLAIRDVISHCVYGVDVNPLAVDLCKLALWLEGHWAGKPLSFLDHRIRCGNSLIGVLDLKILEQGIPDDAFKPVTGDDKRVAAAFRKRNRQERELGQRRLDFEQKFSGHEREFAELLGHGLDFPEDTPADVRRKSEAFEKTRRSQDWWHDWTSTNLWTAAFFLSLTRPGDLAIATHQVLMDYLIHSQDRPQATGAANATAGEHPFFHWPLEFPEVFARGGFDVVLGNPPWEVLQPEETKFFMAVGASEIAKLSGVQRKRAIEQLSETNPRLAKKWTAYQREIETANKFVRGSGRFPLTAVGKLNTYALFAELGKSLLSRSGRVGIIVPTGIATDDANKEFFRELNRKHLLASLFDLENREGLFPGVHRSYKFSLFTISTRTVPVTSFACFLGRTEQIRDPLCRFELTLEDFALLNPNTQTCPIFRTRADAELTKKIYRRAPVLVNEANGENPWGVTLKQGLFNMTSDSNFFHIEPSPGLLRLYEAKMIHQFDHRFATCAGREFRDVTDPEKADPDFTVCPRYWVSEEEVANRASHVPPDLITAVRMADEDLARQILVLWIAGFLSAHKVEGPAEQLIESARRGSMLSDSVRSLLFERIANEGASRNLQEKYPLTPEQFLLIDQADSFVSLGQLLIRERMPKWFLGFRDIARATDERTAIFSLLPKAAVGNNLPLIMGMLREPSLIACLLGNVNSLVFDYVVRQKVGGTHMNFFIVSQLPALAPEGYSTEDVSWISGRVLELVCTANEMRHFAEAMSYEGSPFRWDPGQRAFLRAQLDAYYAHLYGLTREELRYILDPKDVFGEDFPSETFRVLRDKEERTYGEYRTQRLVLAAYDELAKTDRFAGEKRESVIEPPKGRSMAPVS